MEVDDRTGSKELYPRLSSLRVPCCLGSMQFADFRWLGNGPQSRIRIGVERKTLSDALACMTDGRFAGHQVGGLLENYDRVYLLIEGTWKASSSDGTLVQLSEAGDWSWVFHRRKPHVARDLTNWLNTMAVQAGLIVVRTADLADTAYWLRATYHWWQTPWDGHSSLKVIYTPPLPVNVIPHSLTRKWAHAVDGVGWDISELADRRWSSPIEMALATEDDWKELPGVGDKKARSIVAQILGEKPQS